MIRLTHVVAWFVLIATSASIAGVFAMGEVNSTSEALSARPASLVPSPLSQSGKAPSTRSIDPAEAGTWPSDISKGSGSPFGLGGAAKSDGSHMKCWQHGRLIIDKRVRVLPGEAGTANRVRDAETGGEILTFDLKNATCVVQ